MTNAACRESFSLCHCRSNCPAVRCPPCGPWSYCQLVHYLVVVKAVAKQLTSLLLLKPLPQGALPIHCLVVIKAIAKQFATLLSLKQAPKLPAVLLSSTPLLRCLLCPPCWSYHRSVNGLLFIECITKQLLPYYYQSYQYHCQAICCLILVKAITELSTISPPKPSPCSHYPIVVKNTTTCLLPLHNICIV